MKTYTIPPLEWSGNILDDLHCENAPFEIIHCGGSPLRRISLRFAMHDWDRVDEEGMDVWWFSTVGAAKRKAEEFWTEYLEQWLKEEIK